MAVKSFLWPKSRACHWGGSDGGDTAGDAGGGYNASDFGGDFGGNFGDAFSGADYSGGFDSGGSNIGDAFNGADFSNFGDNTGSFSGDSNASFQAAFDGGNAGVSFTDGSSQFGNDFSGGFNDGGGAWSNTGDFNGFSGGGVDFTGGSNLFAGDFSGGGNFAPDFNGTFNSVSPPSGMDLAGDFANPGNSLAYGGGWGPDNAYEGRGADYASGRADTSLPADLAMVGAAVPAGMLGVPGLISTLSHVGIPALVDRGVSNPFAPNTNMGFNPDVFDAQARGEQGRAAERGQINFSPDSFETPDEGRAGFNLSPEMELGRSNDVSAVNETGMVDSYGPGAMQAGPGAYSGLGGSNFVSSVNSNELGPPTDPLAMMEARDLGEQGRAGVLFDAHNTPFVTANPNYDLMHTPFMEANRSNPIDVQIVSAKDVPNLANPLAREAETLPEVNVNARGPSDPQADPTAQVLAEALEHNQPSQLQSQPQSQPQSQQQSQPSTTFAPTAPTAPANPGTPAFAFAPSEAAKSLLEMTPSQMNAALLEAARPGSVQAPTVWDRIADFFAPGKAEAVDDQSRAIAEALERGPQSRPAEASRPATPAAVPITTETAQEAKNYLTATATPGNTMTQQGAAQAIDRLAPEFAVRLASAIQEARANGIPASVFSAFRSPSMGANPGFAFQSMHARGAAVDMAGIGRPGSATAQAWYEIATKHGLHNPYGPNNQAEWNHYQAVPQKESPGRNPFLPPENMQGMWQSVGLGRFQGEQPNTQTAFAPTAPAAPAQAGRGPGASNNATAEQITGRLVDARSRAVAELNNDPQLLDKFLRIMYSETRGQTDQARLATIESALNRAAAEGRSMAEVVEGKFGQGNVGFYPGTPGRMGTGEAKSALKARDNAPPEMLDHYAGLLDEAAKGSNLAKGATGNASGSKGAGNITAKINGEKFGVEKFASHNAWFKALTEKGTQVAAAPAQTPLGAFTPPTEETGNPFAGGKSYSAPQTTAPQDMPKEAPQAGPSAPNSPTNPFGLLTPPSFPEAPPSTPPTAQGAPSGATNAQAAPTADQVLQAVFATPQAPAAPGGVPAIAAPPPSEAKAAPGPPFAPWAPVAEARQVMPSEVKGEVPNEAQPAGEYQLQAGDPGAFQGETGRSGYPSTATDPGGLQNAVPGKSPIASMWSLPGMQMNPGAFPGWAANPLNGGQFGGLPGAGYGENYGIAGAPAGQYGGMEGADYGTNYGKGPAYETAPETAPAEQEAIASLPISPGVLAPRSPDSPAPPAFQPAPTFTPGRQFDINMRDVLPKLTADIPAMFKGKAEEFLKDLTPKEVQLIMDKKISITQLIEQKAGALGKYAVDFLTKSYPGGVPGLSRDITHRDMTQPTPSGIQSELARPGGAEVYDYNPDNPMALMPTMPATPDAKTGMPQNEVTANTPSWAQLGGNLNTTPTSMLEAINQQFPGLVPSMPTSSKGDFQGVTFDSRFGGPYDQSNKGDLQPNTFDSRFGVWDSPLQAFTPTAPSAPGGVPTAQSPATQQAEQEAKSDPQTAQQIAQANPVAVQQIAQQFGVDIGTAAMLYRLMTENQSFMPRGSDGSNFGGWPKMPTPDYPGQYAGVGREMVRQTYEAQNPFNSLPRVNINPQAWANFLAAQTPSSHIEDRRFIDPTMMIGMR